MNFEMITFLDHALNTDEPTVCRVVGEVIKETNLHLVIRYWALLNSETFLPENDCDNDEVVSVIKSTILHRKKSLGWQE